MTASVLAVEKLGQAYIQASGVVLALKSAVTVQLIWASAVFDLGRRLAASGAVSVAQVADWLQGLLLRAKTAVDDAYADAVKRLDDAFADVEAECARLPTEALRTRPADMNRNKPGGEGGN